MQKEGLKDPAQNSSVKFGTIHFNLSWISVNAGCFYELGMFVRARRCVSMYCMSLRGL